jgi:hypothetical protein
MATIRSLREGKSGPLSENPQRLARLKIGCCVRVGAAPGVLAQGASSAPRTGLIVPANAGVAPPGEDTVSYERSTGAVQVDLNVQIPNGTRPTGGPVKATAQHGGFAEGDSLQNISNVTGSDFNDTRIGC